jgi:hypothetical protein
MGRAVVAAAAAADLEARKVQLNYMYITAGTSNTLNISYNCYCIQTFVIINN